MVSNSGHLRVVFDFGFERQELIYPIKHFGMGQYHDMRFQRKNGGTTVVLTVCFTHKGLFKLHINNVLPFAFTGGQLRTLGVPLRY